MDLRNYNVVDREWFLLFCSKINKGGYMELYKLVILIGLLVIANYCLWLSIQDEE